MEAKINNKIWISFISFLAILISALIGFEYLSQIKEFLMLFKNSFR